MAVATLITGASTVDDQHLYTTAEVDSLLWMHLKRREEVNTHGRQVHNYSFSVPKVCPKCLGRCERRRTPRGKMYPCGHCRAKGTVVEVMPPGTSDNNVSEKLIERAELIGAMKRIGDKHRAVVIHFYWTDNMPERIGHLIKRFNGNEVVSARTVHRWRWEAVAVLVRQMNSEQEDESRAKGWRQLAAVVVGEGFE